MVGVSHYTKEITMILLMYVRFNGDTSWKRPYGVENENTKKLLKFNLGIEVFKMVGGCHCCGTIVICWSTWDLFNDTANVRVIGWLSSIELNTVESELFQASSGTLLTPASDEGTWENPSRNIVVCFTALLLSRFVQRLWWIMFGTDLEGN
jgi:hypothetical protein